MAVEQELLWGIIPQNTGPIAESFEENSTAQFEYHVTNFVYGTMALYCIYYLLE